MTPEFLWILFAFIFVLALSVYFTRRRTQDHDNAFTSRTETPHVTPVPPGHTIHTRPLQLKRPVFYTPGPSTTVVYDDATVDMLAQAAAMEIMQGQTVSFQQDDDQGAPCPVCQDTQCDSTSHDYVEPDPEQNSDES